MKPPAGISSHCLPRLRLGLAQLFGRERLGPVNSFASGGGLGRERMKERAVLANAPKIKCARYGVV